MANDPLFPGGRNRGPLNCGGTRIWHRKRLFGQRREDSGKKANIGHAMAIGAQLNRRGS